MKQQGMHFTWIRNARIYNHNDTDRDRNDTEKHHAHLCHWNCSSAFYLCRFYNFLRCCVVCGKPGKFINFIKYDCVMKLRYENNVQILTNYLPVYHVCEV